MAAVSLLEGLRQNQGPDPVLTLGKRGFSERIYGS